MSFEGLEDEQKEFNEKVQQSAKEKEELEAKVEESETKITQLTGDINKLQKKLEEVNKNPEIATLNKELETEKQKVQQLAKENKELENKSKTIQQPKQGNGARYTATVGMGLAAGLIAFTALERTVRLEMLVMIGIAVASALAVGGITYAALPSTQVNGAKAQDANKEKGKG